MSFKADIQATRSTLTTIFSGLDGAINASATTIVVDSAAAFPASGIVQIGSEVISYAAKTSTDLTGCVRGINGTTAASHSSGTVFVLQNVIAPPVRLRAISIASDGGGAGYVELVSNDGIRLFFGDVPTGDVYTLNLPEDGILFPKGVYLKQQSNTTAFTLFTDKYSSKGLTTVQNG